MEDEKLEIVRPYGESEIETHAGKSGGKRNLREITVTTDDGYQFVYLVKKPSRAVIQAVTEAEHKKDLTSVQKLMLGCVLEGDKDAYEHDGAVYSSLLEQIGNLVNSVKSDIKKL